MAVLYVKLLVLAWSMRLFIGNIDIDPKAIYNKDTKSIRNGLFTSILLEQERKVQGDIVKNVSRETI